MPARDVNLSGLRWAGEYSRVLCPSEAITLRPPEFGVVVTR